MRKDQLITFGLIIVVGLLLFFFGRTNSGPPPDITGRAAEALKARQVPVLVVVEGRDRDYVRDLKAALGEQKRVQVLVANSQDPQEKAALAGMPLKKPPFVMVIGLDGQAVYRTQGTVDATALQKAVAEGLKRPPIMVSGENEGHQH